MDNRLQSKHLRNAETQMAVDLLNTVKRFVASKKHRLTLSQNILVKARELEQASLLLNPAEPPITNPIPPLASARQRKIDNTSGLAASQLTEACGFDDARSDYLNGEPLERLWATANLPRLYCEEYDKGIIRFCKSMGYSG